MKMIHAMSSSGFLTSLLSILFFFCITFQVRAQTLTDTSHPLETGTEWKGIHFQVVRVQHILQNRLMVEVRAWADKTTPGGGVFLGTPGPTPPANIKAADLYSGRYNPKPYSLAGATMTDDLSGTQYPVLPAVAPPGKAYYPSFALATLRPGAFVEMSIQFATPPPPPLPPPGQKPTPQTLSFLLPKAKGPILHVPLPPNPEAAKT